MARHLKDNFQDGNITSDRGVLLLQQISRRLLFLIFSRA